MRPISSWIKRRASSKPMPSRPSPVWQYPIEQGHGTDGNHARNIAYHHRAADGDANQLPDVDCISDSHGAVSPPGWGLVIAGYFNDHGQIVRGHVSFDHCHGHPGACLLRAQLGSVMAEVSSQLLHRVRF